MGYGETVQCWTTEKISINKQLGGILKLDYDSYSNGQFTIVVLFQYPPPQKNDMDIKAVKKCRQFGENGGRFIEKYMLV